MRKADEFDEFYRATYDRVLAYLYVAGGDLAEAQDAAQEAYLRAWSRWASLAGYVDPEQWVRKVGWRELASRWRRLRRRRAAYLRHGPPAPVPPVNEDLVVLVSALRRISPQQRNALVLFHMVGLSVAEIAEQTDSPAGTVKARLARGRTALADVLATPEVEMMTNV
jgi:RNA polymerase sigma-70 factor (ECF subfamily)